VQKFAGNILASVFWDQDDILLIDYLPKSQTVKAEYYSTLLVQMKDILKEKRHGNFTKSVLFLHDNAPAHRALATQKKLPTCATNVLITHHILRIWPRQTITCSPDRKTIERPPFFVRRGGHWWRGDLVGRKTFRIFFDWLAEVRATG